MTLRETARRGCTAVVVGSHEVHDFPSQCRVNHWSRDYWGVLQGSSRRGEPSVFLKLYGQRAVFRRPPRSPGNHPETNC
eukprot:4563034-Prymnesium_polylepis.1